MHTLFVAHTSSIMVHAHVQHKTKTKGLSPYLRNERKTYATHWWIDGSLKEKKRKINNSNKYDNNKITRRYLKLIIGFGVLEPIQCTLHVPSACILQSIVQRCCCCVLFLHQRKRRCVCVCVVVGARKWLQQIVASECRQMYGKWPLWATEIHWKQLYAPFDLLGCGLRFVMCRGVAFATATVVAATTAMCMIRGHNIWLYTVYTGVHSTHYACKKLRMWI